MVIKAGYNIKAEDVNKILEIGLVNELRTKYLWCMVNKTLGTSWVFKWDNEFWIPFTDSPTYVYTDILYQGTTFTYSGTNMPYTALGSEYTTVTELDDNDDNANRFEEIDAYVRRISLVGSGTYTQVYSDTTTYYATPQASPYNKNLSHEYSFTEASVRKIEYDYFNGDDLYDCNFYTYAEVDGRMVLIDSFTAGTSSSGTRTIILNSGINISKIQIRTINQGGGSGTETGFNNFKVYRDDYTSSGTVTTGTLITTSSDITGVFVYATTKTPSDSSITVDVSIDGGTTWITGNSLNTWIDTSSNTGTELVLRFNLNPSSDNTRAPELIDFGVIATT